MSKGKFVYFLYQKDFSEKGNDRYFVYEDGLFSEVGSEYIVSLESFVVTHDFWLIVNSLYKQHQKLPPKIIDITVLSRIVAGKKAEGGNTQPWDISETISPLYTDPKDFKQYMSMYYRREGLNKDIYMLFSHKLSEYMDKLLYLADKTGELTRFYDLEVPVFNLLTKVVSRGLRVSKKVIKEHKSNIKHDFYRGLKEFAEKHSVPYELPIEGDIRDKLRSLGYDVENYSIDFLINFLPSPDGYTTDLKKLQKLNKSYRVLNSISSGVSRLNPMIDSHSTSTSRIYYKSPNIQNLSRKYRNIFIPDDGLHFSYIDYDQFEVGIMASLSGDEVMSDIYTNSDAYIGLSNTIFSSGDYRKKCKILFLSYTYGMSIENILGSIEKQGGNRKAAKAYFSNFEAFEHWKEALYEKFEQDKRISTVCGNYLNRTKAGVLTNKEKRSVVSHVVQGTGSYIFKSALLELSKQYEVDVLVPMHDALLIQHSPSYKMSDAVNILKDTMTEILGGKIKGKASIEEFYNAT